MATFKQIDRFFERLATAVDSGSNSPITKVALYTVTSVTLLWMLNWLLIFASPTSRGTIGDMFGTLNALFSGLAFVGVIYAILLQRAELQLQRKDNEYTRDELALTRKEVKGQTDELLRSNQFRAHQNFENTFFQMLNVLQAIVGGMDLLESGSHKTISRGRDCFKTFVNQLNTQRQYHKKNHPDKDAIFTYEELYKIHRSDLGHYFRTLYNIIKLIEKSDVADKRFYTNLVRAQMSDYEVAILYLNCLSRHGIKKFKPLVEKYSLLKMMDFDIVTDARDFKNSYTVNAYR